MKRLIPRVYAYVAAHVEIRADADDITGAVFERAVRYQNSFDPGKGTVLAWLIGIARNEIHAHRQAPSAAEPDDHIDERSIDRDDETVERLTLWGAVARLDGPDRELIALRYGADLSSRQIAKVLGRRTNAVEVALHRALKRLRAELDGIEGNVGLNVSNLAVTLPVLDQPGNDL